MNLRALFAGFFALTSIGAAVASPTPLTCTSSVQNPNGTQYVLHVQDSSFSSVSYDGHPTSRASITTVVGGRSQGSSLLDVSPYPQPCLNNCPSIKIVDSRWVEDANPDIVITVSSTANAQGVMQGLFHFNTGDHYFPALCTLGN